MTAFLLLLMIAGRRGGKRQSSRSEDMSTTTYGYARVSSREQNTDRQIDSLKSFPVAERNIFIDKQSGKDFCRPAWKKLVRKAKEGDVIVVHSIDRLGRNYSEIIEQWRSLTKDKQVDLVIMDMPLLDTRRGKDDLTGLFISDLVLQIMSYVAENERINIRQRQAEGIEAAKKRGVRFGRPRKELPENFEEIVSRWRNDELTFEEVLTYSGVSRSCFYRNIKERKI